MIYCDLMKTLLALLLLIPSLSWGDYFNLNGKYISCMVDLQNAGKSQIVVKFKKKGKALVFVSINQDSKYWRLVNSGITGYNDPGDTRYSTNLTQIKLGVPNSSLHDGNQNIIINRQTLEVEKNYYDHGSCNVLSEEKYKEIIESIIYEHEQFLIKKKEDHNEKLEELKNNQKI